MKTPRSSHELRWEKLLQQARADLAPPIDGPALISTVRQARVTPPEGWFAEFTGLFSTGRTVQACLIGTSALALVAAWQIWTFWQALPWAELALGGGAS